MALVSIFGIYSEMEVGKNDWNGIFTIHSNINKYILLFRSPANGSWISTNANSITNDNFMFAYQT